MEHTALHSEKVHSAKCAMVQNPMGIYHVHEKEDKKTQGRQRTWSEVVLWCMLQQCKGQFTVIVRWSVVTVHMGRGGGMECKQGKTKTETGASEDMVRGSVVYVAAMQRPVHSYCKVECGYCPCKGGRERRGALFSSLTA